MRPFPTPIRRDAPWAAVALVATALALQAWLVATPGYFSHDELQWAARATAGVPAGWTDVDALQWRPLTFELWMALSRALFESPHLFHLAFAALGAGIALLLWTVLRAAGAPAGTAFAAALGFVASPYAMYVHGWVATLGDLLWTACALGTGLAALKARTTTRLAAVALVLMAAALLAKESALSIPGLAALLALLDGTRRRAWIVVTTAASAVALGYLALRYPALSAPAPGEAYAWQLANLPRRWIEYQLYSAQLRVFEVHNVLASTAGAAVAGLAWLAATAALAVRGPRWLGAWLVGGAAALGPVLVLGQAASQYGYAYAAWCAGVLALAWPGTPRWGRLAIAGFALAVAAHGALVARQIHRVGTIEARFSRSVLEVLALRPDGILRVAPEPEADAWIFRRVTHAVPTYRGREYSPRIRLVGAGEPADVRIRADGSLVPAR